MSGGQAKGRSLLAPACSPTRLSTWAGLLCVFVTLTDSAYEKAVATGTDRASHRTITRLAPDPLRAGLGSFRLTLAEMHRAVALGCPGKWDFRSAVCLVQIARKESDFDPKCFYKGHWGLFQFTRHNMDKYGLTKDSGPIEQCRAGWLYARDRYRGPVNARGHWERRSWW